MGDFNPLSYDNNFIADLVEFVSNDSFQNLFENFFLEHAMKFDYNDEHKLIYTELYTKFSNLFEIQLETFCESKHITQGEFVKKCREISNNDPSGKTKKYIDILLSSVEYETFVRLMQIMRPVAEERALELSLTNNNKAEPKTNNNTKQHSSSSKGSGGGGTSKDDNTTSDTTNNNNYEEHHNNTNSLSAKRTSSESKSDLNLNDAKVTSSHK